jgi:uncharacterized protein (TIGR02452 family)
MNSSRKPPRQQDVPLHSAGLPGMPEELSSARDTGSSSDERGRAQGKTALPRDVVWADTCAHLQTVTRDIEIRKISTGDVTLPNTKPAGNPVTLIDDDSFSAAQGYVCRGMRTAVLNFANPQRPALGAPLENTQEEDLMRRSDLGLFLYDSLRNLQGNRWYPLHNDELLIASDVTVFKDRFGDAIDPFKVDVISACALVLPKRTRNGEDFARQEDRESMREIIRTIYFAAHSAGADVIVLGAFGCGAFAGPVAAIARILFTEAQTFPFREVVLAVPSRHGMRTYETFDGQLQKLTTARRGSCM